MRKNSNAFYQKCIKVDILKIHNGIERSALYSYFHSKPAARPQLHIPYRLLPNQKYSFDKLISHYEQKQNNKTNYFYLFSSSRLPIANTCQTYPFISSHIIKHLFLFPNLCSTCFTNLYFPFSWSSKSFLCKHLSNFYMNVLWKITTVYSVPG